VSRVFDGFCPGFSALYEYVEPGFAKSTLKLKMICHSEAAKPGRNDKKGLA
jgi:hypothetical protein